MAPSHSTGLDFSRASKSPGIMLRIQEESTICMERLRAGFLRVTSCPLWLEDWKTVEPQRTQSYTKEKTRVDAGVWQCPNSDFLCGLRGNSWRFFAVKVFGLLST